MSSLRNAVSRRNHKERSQPLERQKFGLLEKKKDYILRARDFHRKQDYLKKLREKATDRNPDEFYFGMMTEKTRKGVVVKDRGNTTLSEDALKVLRTQDAGYVRTMRQIESKKIERLEAELHVLDDETPDAHKGKKRKHTVFVNDESHAKTFDAASHFDTHPSLVSRSSNRPRLDQLESVSFAPSNVEMDERKIQKEREARLRELDARTQRGDMLRKLEKETVLQRNLQGKGARKKTGVDKDGTAVYKWKQERKR